jgi:hypothetical protein
MEKSQYTPGVFGKSKPILKCAGLGGSTSSIAARKTQSVPRKPVSGIFRA